ncbi:MAG: hypothetical protein ACM3ZU_00110 [Bacteroidota bacterium]
MKRLVCIVMVLMALAVAGCDDFSQVKTSVAVNPDCDLTEYTRFFLYRPTNNQAYGTAGVPTPDSAYETLVAELVRKGYTQVATLEEADFIIYVVATNEYREEYIPAQVIPMPQYVPGQTVTTYGSSSGFIGTTPFWGTTTTTTTTPGYWTSRPVVVPSHYRGVYYPFILMTFTDARAFLKENIPKDIWAGCGIKASRQSSIASEAPLIVKAILRVLPDVKGSK